MTASPFGPRLKSEKSGCAAVVSLHCTALALREDPRAPLERFRSEGQVLSVTNTSTSVPLKRSCWGGSTRDVHAPSCECYSTVIVAATAIFYLLYSVPECALPIRPSAARLTARAPHCTQSKSQNSFSSSSAGTGSCASCGSSAAFLRSTLRMYASYSASPSAV